MLPLYLFLLADSIRVVVRAASRSSRGQECGIWITSLFLFCLLPTCRNVEAHYAKQLKMAMYRLASIRITRIEPRRWFENHALPGARIAHVWGSVWASPPIFDLGYSFSARLLDIPLLY